MRFWLLNPRLYSAAGDGGEGGGGGAGADGGDKGTSGALTIDAISKLFDDKLNGYDKRLNKRLQAIEGTRKTDPPKDDDDTTESKKTTDKGDSKVDPEVAKMKRELAELRKQSEADKLARVESEKRAQAKERDSSIRGALSGFSFVDSEAAETAFSRIAGEVKFNDKGELVADNDEETPLKDYVSGRMQKLSFLVRPKDVGGAGAGSDRKQSSGGKGNAGPVDIKNIKPGMSAEDVARTTAEIRAALNM